MSVWLSRQSRHSLSAVAAVAVVTAAVVVVAGFMEAEAVVSMVVAVVSAPKIRYARLTKRNHRPLNGEEAAGRDRAEIENLNKGGPIAMAEFNIVNEADLRSLHRQTEAVVAKLKEM